MEESGQGDRVAHVIQEYDAQGWHRTGTEVDHASARWLAERVRDSGLEPALESFGLSRIDPHLSYLEADGRRISGLPLFDGGLTGPEGVRGRIGAVGFDAEIGLVEVSRRSVEAFLDARRSGGHRALVAVTIGGAPGLAARNAESFLSPFGPPVLQVGSEARTWLAERAERGSEAYLLVSASRTEAESFNVVAHLRGRDERLAPLVVMTPRTGWWHCAGERGGGLACWLEVMRAIAEAGAARDVLFVATSAHEIGLLGIESFLERRPRLAADALAWIHFGASIGAGHESTLFFSASDDELEQSARLALTRVGAYNVVAASGGRTVGAESQVVQSRGARCVAMAGGSGHTLFHLEADRWPSGIDVGLVARCARAFANVAIELINRPGDG